MKRLDSRIYKLLQHGKYSKDELAEVMGVAAKDVKDVFDYLEAKGISIKCEQGRFYVPDTQNTTLKYVLSPASSQPQERVFAVTSDWHVGSIQHDKGGLEACITKAKEHGAEFALHSGDMVDGNNVYSGQLNNLLVWKIDDQVALAKAEIDSLAIPVFGIGGNHDYSFTKACGARPTKALSERCSSFTDLGDFQAEFILDGIDIRLIHGAGGNAYAQSYPAQRYLRNLAEGTPELVPDMLLLGHFHTNPVFDIYGCLVMHPGNFQSPNDYMIRRGLRGVRGLFVVQMTTQRGEILKYDTRFLKTY